MEDKIEIGDLVEVKSFEDLKKEATVVTDDGLCFSGTSCGFSRGMKNLCGEKAVVTNVGWGRIEIRFIREKELRQRCDIYWNWVEEFFNIVEKGYAERIRKEKEEKIATAKENAKEKVAKDIDKDTLKEEMKSKVDVKKVKKILSLCFMKPQKDFKGIDKLLDQWAENKYKLYDMLGRTLRLEKEIEFDATASDWYDKRTEIMREFPGTFGILRNLDWTCFKDNRYSTFDSDFEREYMPQAKDGMKLTRFISMAFKNEKLDTLLSQKIDETRIKGVITISIDPIDYLLMSINRSGWQSCHSLHEGNGREFGCYSGGVFSYMTDTCTAISYRHSPQEVEYKINNGRFTEYSKNWRECLYIDTESGNFVASRQYPREDVVIAKFVRELLEEQIAKYFDIENHWKVINERRTIKEHMCNYDMDMGDVGQDVEDSSELHYNDIWHGYNGKIIYNTVEDNLEETQIFVGNSPVCPICGERDIEEHSHPCCDHCYYEL